MTSGIQVAGLGGSSQDAGELPLAVPTPESVSFRPRLDAGSSFGYCLAKMVPARSVSPQQEEWMQGR